MAAEIPQAGIGEEDRAPREKTLADFVVDVKKSQGREARFLSSEQLEQAIRDGTLSEEEINRSAGINIIGEAATLSQHIQRFESRRAQSDNSRDQESWRELIDEYRIMQQARDHYIPVPENVSFDIHSNDRTKLQQDFSNWLGERRGKYKGGSSVYELRPLNSTDEAVSYLFRPRGNKNRRISADIVLDYPTLSHVITIAPITKSSRPKEFGGAYYLSLKFFQGSYDPVEGTMNCPADMLSLVRLVNVFKARGHSARFPMKSDGVSAADGSKTRIMYIVR